MLRRHSYIMNEYLVLDIVREQRLARAIKPYIKWVQKLDSNNNGGTEPNYCLNAAIAKLLVFAWVLSGAWDFTFFLANTTTTTNLPSLSVAMCWLNIRYEMRYK